MSFLLSISRAIDRVSGWFGAVIAVITMVMILVGVWNVIGRFIGRAVGQNLTSNSFLEWQWYLFSLVFLLGGAYVLRHNEHVRVDVFYARMTPRGRAITNLVGTLLFLIPFCIIMLYVNWQFFYTSWLIREGSPDPGGLPRYPIKFAIVLGFALLLLQAVSELIKSAAILMGRLHEERKDQLELIKAEVVEGP